MFNIRPVQRGNQLRTKRYFRDNKLSGLYQDFDPYTGKLKEEGQFEMGLETGHWIVIDADGDQIHFLYTIEKVGAICNDGTTSKAKGRGACSGHGGVKDWLYKTDKVQTGGTGKHFQNAPIATIEQRVEKARQEVKRKLGINQTGLEFEEITLNMLLKLIDVKEEILTQVGSLKEELRGEKASNEGLLLELEDIKKEKLELEQKLRQATKEKTVPKERPEQVEEKPKGSSSLDVTAEVKKENAGQEKDDETEKTQKIGTKVEMKAKPLVVEKPEAAKEEKQEKEESEESDLESDLESFVSVEDNIEAVKEEYLQ